MDFKQWDFVKIRQESDYIDGLIISEDCRTVIWKDGVVTYQNLIQYYAKGNSFDLYDALINAKDLRIEDTKHIFDNLTFVEISAKLKEHEQNTRRV